MDAAADASTASETPPWHAISADEVVERLAANREQGLDAGEAAARLQKYGPNRLPEGKKRGPFMRFLAQFNNILVYVLLGAGFTKLMLSLWVDAAIIFGVVVLNALLGFIQEGRAEKALDSIRNMLSAEARTVRGGETRMIPAEQLVPGDIVLLESGDKIPADLRLVEAKNLRTEEAALTGESVPADKTTDPVAANATVGDRESMAFSGTMVVSGRATGVVVATGSETELGRINQLLAGVSALETPLLRQIKKFGYAITAVIGVVSVLVFAYGQWVEGMDFVELFQAVVGIAVSVIPEGLPAIITITLAIGVQRMAQRNAIIRRLPAVETLGSVSRICSDKTGTLTLMEMMVVSAVTAEAAYQITGDGYAPEGEVRKDGKPAGKAPVLDADGARLDALQRRGAVPGGGRLEGGGRSDRGRALSVRDQARDGPAGRAGGVSAHRRHPVRIGAQVHGDAPPGGGRRGDAARQGRARSHPRALRPAADCRRPAGAARSRALPCSASDKLAGQGERVLALAWLENPGVKAGSLGPADLPKTLVLLGLVGLLDPPRKEAIEAVKECHGGGIRVTMITGDHKITAAAIAKMLGIGDGKTAITGAEIEEMDTATLQERVRDVDVFARASPEHKLRLVKAIQANKQIVAMTGDGVNDAPALKKADIGVAMGIKGTEVTKEAAGMILADDNFASITAAVKEGRTVYNNIEKAMLFMLPTNVAQALVIAVAIFFGFTMPITAPQVLWVNMVTSVALGLVISFEPHELDVMQRPPRAVDRPILTGFGIWRVVFVGLALLAYTLLGVLLDEVAGRLGRSSPARSRSTPSPSARSSTCSTAATCSTRRSRSRRISATSICRWASARWWSCSCCSPTRRRCRRLFGNEAIPLWVWPWLLLGGLVFFLVVEAEKLDHPLVADALRSGGDRGRGGDVIEDGARRR